MKLNPGQKRALDGTIRAGARNCLLYGGSRSGKTALFVNIIDDRALAAPGSWHLIVRKEAVDVKTKVMQSTFPTIWQLKHGQAPLPSWNGEFGYYEYPNKSRIWAGGMNDAKAMERLLGGEYATIYINEASQITYEGFLLLRTRLAQTCKRVLPAKKEIDGTDLPQRMYVDLNPTSNRHWTYQLWVDGVEPNDQKPVDRSQYRFTVINPDDNRENLSPEYLAELAAAPERTRKRFFLGEYVADEENALWRREFFKRAHTKEDGTYPMEMRRIVVAIDPAATSSPGSDETGIIAVGQGSDGNGYVLDDASGRFRPEEWARRAVSVYKELNADRIIAEVNNGGEMVEATIRAVDPSVPVTMVRASRGKVTRAEPVAALYERGKVRHMGYFPELEDQCCFPAGASVWTYRGRVPIETVCVGDVVMTRQGFAPVKVARQTGISSEFVAISAANGGVLECTLNHPIFTLNRGYVSAQDVRIGDHLLDERSLESMGCLSLGGGAGITGCETDTSATRRGFFSIGRSGWRIAATFLRECTSIMSMATRAITRSAIWYAFLPQRTQPGTSLGAGMPAVYMAQRHPTFARPNGQGESRWTIAASSAEWRFRAGSLWPPIAASFAGNAPDRLPRSRTESARSVAPGSGPATPASGIVVSGAVRRQTTPRAVYNLEVADGYLPEYVADGFLVHNCAMTTAFDRNSAGWSPDRVDALVWAVTDLFPALSARKLGPEKMPVPRFSMV